jgi:S1-C subfamily serine protease
MLNSRFWVVVGCLLAGAVGGAIARELLSVPTLAQSGLGLSPAATPVFPPAQLAAGNSTDVPLLPEEQVSIAVYETSNRSVVHIATKSAAMRSFLQIEVREGTGSGSILNRDGLILTNQHVIDGAREITVSLYNGASYPAMLIGQDSETDIAILKIDAPANALLPLVWGKGQELRVGHRIYAIGNPFGLERTMSTGMISALNRQIPSRENRTMRSLIQIDASINQGNSGGPLLNTRGELIGMNTAIMSNNGDSAGVGFAIPVSTLERVVPQLIKEGRVLRPSIGIARVYETERGLLIVGLTPGGPAEVAGLRGFKLAKKMFRQGAFQYEQTSVDPAAADLIKAIDDQPVVSADDLLSAIETKKPGDTVRVRIIREGREQNVDVMLGSPD